MTEELEVTKLDFSKIRKNSRDYNTMTDEQRAQWNDYQKEKQREYRLRRKAEREEMEEKIAETTNAAPKTPEIEGEITAGQALYICSDCGQQLAGGEDTCPNCGVLCDWRGTDIAASDDTIVCDLCGFAEPVTAFNGKCKRCGWTGK